MRRRRIAVLDLVTNASTTSLWGRAMNANFASIMPQVVGVWCKQAGHEVSYLCFTGAEDLARELPSEMDLVFLGAFTESAQLVYALSDLFRQRGAITVLGGPHARSYPDDACRYFDYVLGFTDREVIDEVLEECAPHRPHGRHLSAAGQPETLPGVRERWPFIQRTVAKTRIPIKVVPMIASLGCPYTCSFCIDSVVAYQPIDPEQLCEDLRFLRAKMPRAWVGWHDPNFGVRFDECMAAIEETVSGSSLTFGGESSLSLLGEDRLPRLRAIRFRVMAPGIESWYTFGNKAKTGRSAGLDKVEKVADHVNTILDYIPYVQTNFVLGLDSDEGPEPFELTKRFLHRVPGAFPAFSLLTAFGEAAPLNLEYQEAGRVLPFPFHFLNNHKAMNVRPKHYEWPEFYDRLIDLTRYAVALPRIGRRLRANGRTFAAPINLLRAVSTEGHGRIRYYSQIRALLDTDRRFRDYFEGETTEIPSFYVERVRRDLGPFWEYLPPGALEHDPNAYLKKVGGGERGAVAGG